MAKAATDAEVELHGDPTAAKLPERRELKWTRAPAYLPRDPFEERARELRTVSHACSLSLSEAAEAALAPERLDGALRGLLRAKKDSTASAGVAESAGHAGALPLADDDIDETRESAHAFGVLADPLGEMLALALVSDRDVDVREAAESDEARIPARIVTLPAATRVRLQLAPAHREEMWARPSTVAAESTEACTLALLATDAHAISQRRQRKDASVHHLELPMILKASIGAPNRRSAVATAMAWRDATGMGWDSLQHALYVLSPADVVSDPDAANKRKLAALRRRAMEPGTEIAGASSPLRMASAPAEGVPGAEYSDHGLDITPAQLARDANAALRRVSAAHFQGGAALLESPVALGSAAEQRQRASRLFIAAGACSSKSPAGELVPFPPALVSLVRIAERCVPAAAAAYDGMGVRMDETAVVRVNRMLECSGLPLFDTAAVLAEVCIARSTGAPASRTDPSAVSPQEAFNVAHARLTAGVFEDCSVRPASSDDTTFAHRGRRTGQRICGASAISLELPVAVTACDVLGPCARIAFASLLKQSTIGAGRLDGGYPSSLGSYVGAELVPLVCDGDLAYSDVSRLVVDADIAASYAMFPPPALPPSQVPDFPPPLVDPVALASRLALTTGTLCSGAVSTLYLDWHLSARGACTDRSCFRAKQLVADGAAHRKPARGMPGPGRTRMHVDEVIAEGESAVARAGGSAAALLDALRYAALRDKGGKSWHSTLVIARAIQEGRVSHGPGYFTRCARPSDMTGATADACRRDSAAACGTQDNEEPNGSDGHWLPSLARTQTAGHAQRTRNASSYRQEVWRAPLSELQTSIVKAMRRDYEELLCANGCAVAEACSRGGCRTAFVFDLLEGETDARVAELAAAAPEGASKQGLMSLYLLRQAARHCFQHGISVAHLFLQHALFAAGSRATLLRGELLRETYVALAAAYEAVETHEAVDHPKIELLVDKLRSSAAKAPRQCDGAWVVVVQHPAAASALVPALAASGLQTHCVRRRSSAADVVEGVNIALNEGHECILCAWSDIGAGFPWERFGSLVEFDGMGTCSSLDAFLGEAVHTHGLQHYLVRIDAPNVICDFVREEEERIGCTAGRADGNKLPANVRLERLCGDCAASDAVPEPQQQAQIPSDSPVRCSRLRTGNSVAAQAAVGPRDGGEVQHAQRWPAVQEGSPPPAEALLQRNAARGEDGTVHHTPSRGTTVQPPVPPHIMLRGNDCTKQQQVGSGPASAGAVPRADGDAGDAEALQTRDVRAWGVVANSAERGVGGASMTPLPSRRRTYRHLVEMDEAGKINLVERVVEMAFDLALSPTTCVAIIDAAQLEGIAALAKDEVAHANEQGHGGSSAPATSDTVVDIVGELFLAPLSQCFDVCHLIIEGHRDVLRHWPAEADMCLATVASALGASAVFHTTSGQDATGMLLKALVLEEASSAAAGPLTAEAAVAPIAEAPSHAETEMLHLRCLNPLSANAILRSGLSVETLLSLPVAHQQRHTGMSQRLLRHLAAAYAPVRACDNDMRGDEAERLDAQQQRHFGTEEAQREDQERRLRAAAARSDGSLPVDIEDQIGDGAALDEALKSRRRAEAQLTACCDNAEAALHEPDAAQVVHDGGKKAPPFVDRNAGNDLEALDLLEDYGRGVRSVGMAGEEAFPARGTCDVLLGDRDESFLTPLPTGERAQLGQTHTAAAIVAPPFPCGVYAEVRAGGRAVPGHARGGSCGEAPPRCSPQQPRGFDDFDQRRAAVPTSVHDRAGVLGSADGTLHMSHAARALPLLQSHNEILDRAPSRDHHADQGCDGRSPWNGRFGDEIAAFNPQLAQVDAMLAQDDEDFLTPVPEDEHTRRAVASRTGQDPHPSTWPFTTAAARALDAQRTHHPSPRHPQIDAAAFGPASMFTGRAAQVGNLTAAIGTRGVKYGRQQQAGGDAHMLAAAVVATRSRHGSGRGLSCGAKKSAGRRHPAPRRREARPQHSRHKALSTGGDTGGNGAGTFSKGFRAKLPHPDGY